jgi:hypothetical protein
MRQDGNLLHLHEYIKKRAVPSRLYSAWQYTRASPKSHQSTPGHSPIKATPKTWPEKQRKYPRSATDHDRGLVTTQTFKPAHTRPHRPPSLWRLPRRKSLVSQSVGGPYQAKSSHPSASLGAGLSHGSGCLPSQRQSQNG